MLISKGIGHYKNEGKQVVIDLGLQNNELLVFDENGV